MSGTLLFVVGVFAVVTLWLVQSPPRRPGEIAVSLFAWSWLAGELPLHLAATLVSLVAVLVATGALDSELGVVGLVLSLVGLVGPVLSWREASRVRVAAERVFGHAVEVAGVGLGRYLFPAWFYARDVELTHHRTDGVELDLYAPRTPATSPRPVLVYVHGGGWVLGFRRWQGRLFIRRLVSAGWLVASVEYRRWPRVTWPGSLDDTREALAWVRARLPALGGDPERVAISGNSAGAHLAALVALTDHAHNETCPPLMACVGWYGVYDLVDEAGHWPHGALERLWAWLIMREAKVRALDRWREASPIHHVHAAAPPFLVIHGTRDSLVPIEASRTFANRLEHMTGRPVMRFEVEGAQHAFDVFTSRRGAIAVEVAARYLEATPFSAAERRTHRGSS